MNLFLPGVGDRVGAEDVREAIRCYLVEWGFLTTPRRIRRLAFTCKGEAYDLEVGGRHPEVEREPSRGYPREDERIRSRIVAIFEASRPRCYLVCTPYRGVIRSYPWLVGFDTVTLVVEGDGGSP